jgi:hypothetical protein
MSRAFCDISNGQGVICLALSPLSPPTREIISMQSLSPVQDSRDPTVRYLAQKTAPTAWQIHVLTRQYLICPLDFEQKLTLDAFSIAVRLAEISAA